MCPFHGNIDTPAFSVGKLNGLYVCFNPGCDAHGTLEELVRRTRQVNVFQAKKIIVKAKSGAPKSSVLNKVNGILDTPTFTPFDQHKIDNMIKNFPGSVAQEYMKARGFDDTTLSYFGVGYSASKNLVTVPMHAPDGTPIGVIGRSPTEKKFQNSYGLPKAKTMWNFHRAKKHDSVVICEASYDAMMVHQAGYPNVVALLGGHISPYHVEQLNRTFSTIVIMTDFDQPRKRPNCKLCNYRPCVGHRDGRILGRAIQKAVPNKRVLWAVYNDDAVYPHDAKDACDMTQAEIRQVIEGAESTFAYNQRHLD